MTSAGGAPRPVFRATGAYWGFMEGDRLYDRDGRLRGWLEPVPGRAPEVFDLGGRFLGELVESRYVLRHRLRAQPVPRAPRPALRHPAPPDRWPDQAPRPPQQDWVDALAAAVGSPDPPVR